MAAIDSTTGKIAVDYDQTANQERPDPAAPKFVDGVTRRRLRRVDG